MATSPTAFSWYGIIGVVATGVTTFLATCKWKDDQRDTLFFDAVNDSEPSTKEKAKRIGKTALIFAGPVCLAAGACYCIYRGNTKAMNRVSQLMTANTFLSTKIDRGKDMAIGMAANEIRNRLDKENESPAKVSGAAFSDDPAGEVEDFGKVISFYDDYCEEWFESTIFDVMKAEAEVNKIFALRGYAAVGELYAFMGIEPEEWTYQCGWDSAVGIKHGYVWIDYSHYRRLAEDGTPYYIIKYSFNPVFLDEFEWLSPYYNS